MKKYTLVILAFISIGAHCQTFKIDNKDSCKKFICSKIWILHNYDRGEMKLYGAYDTLVFYENGTYTLNHSRINDEEHLHKKEKGKWDWSGVALGKFGKDTANYSRDILMTTKIHTGESAYQMRLIDGTKYINKRYPINFPYMGYDSADSNPFFTQRP